MLKAYYYLAKPGIVYGNLITAAAGFLLASKNHINIGLFLALVVGTASVIGAACVFNNVMDRGIDARMARTKKRALVSGKISPQAALIYGGVLGMCGFLVLAIFTNWLTVIIELIAFIFYTVLYGWAKRKTSLSTLIGSIPGAAPPVAGYCAVSGQLDGAALILFLILVFWQMPHFYGIALYRYKDYEAAGLPVMPVSKGILSTKIQIVGYIGAFIVAVTALTGLGYTGYEYLVVVGVLGIYWLLIGSKGFKAKDDSKWGRQVFLFSLIVNMGFCLMVATNALWKKL